MVNTDLSFEEFNYEKMKALLPEGFEPLPYVKIPGPKIEKLIKVVGFPSEEIAIKRMQEIRNHYPSDKYQVIPNNVETVIKDFALIIPASAQAFLAGSETIEVGNPPLISLTTYLPTLYRFFDKEEYEDNFFKKGELLISTFKRCKTEEIKDRKDIFENQNKVIIKDGNCSIEPVIGFDFETLILCTSLSQVNTKSDGSIYEYGFKINDTAAFFDILTRALVSKGIAVAEVLRGPCVYNNKLITLDATGSGLAEAFLTKSKQGVLDFGPTMQFILSNAQNQILMNKPTVFSKENEFRHVWKLVHPITRETVADDVTINDDGSIIVRVPELVQFCEHL